MQRTVVATLILTVLTSTALDPLGVQAQSAVESAEPAEPAEPVEYAEDEARDLFQAARTAAEQGRMGEARDLFRESLSRFSTAATAFNLARTLHDTGEYVEAADVEDRLLRGDFGDLDAERIAAVGVLRRESGAQVGVVVVSVFGSGPITVRLDGRRVEQAHDGDSFELVVDPGRHLVTVTSLDSGLEASQEVMIDRGEHTQLELRISAPEPETERETPAVDEDGWPWGWVVAGAAFVLIVGGLTAFLLLNANHLPSEFVGETTALSPGF